MKKLLKLIIILISNLLTQNLTAQIPSKFNSCAECDGYPFQILKGASFSQLSPNHWSLIFQDGLLPSLVPIQGVENHCKCTVEYINVEFSNPCSSHINIIYNGIQLDNYQWNAATGILQIPIALLVKDPTIEIQFECKGEGESRPMRLEKITKGGLCLIQNLENTEVMKSFPSAMIHAGIIPVLPTPPKGVHNWKTTWAVNAGTDFFLTPRLGWGTSFHFQTRKLGAQILPNQGKSFAETLPSHIEEIKWNVFQLQTGPFVQGGNSKWQWLARISTGISAIAPNRESTAFRNGEQANLLEWDRQNLEWIYSAGFRIQRRITQQVRVYVGFSFLDVCSGPWAWSPRKPKEATGHNRNIHLNTSQTIPSNTAEIPTRSLSPEWGITIMLDSPKTPTASD